MAVKTVINAAGRRVPLEINGQPVIPFKGVGKHRPSGRKYLTSHTYLHRFST